MTDRATPRGTSSEQLTAMWRRQLAWWHGLFAALVLVALVLVVAAHGPGLQLQLGCLAGTAVAYAVWGRRGIGGIDERSAYLYVGVAWALFLVALTVDAHGESWLLPFALFPQTWAMLEARRAVPVVVVVVLGFVAVRLWQSDRPGETTAEILVSSGISLVLSLVLGLFIDKIVREAESRARVIDELHHTQADLAAAERAQGVAAERDRISREIHDTLAQGFTSVVTLARATASALERGDLTAVRERLRLIESTAVDNLSEARLIVAELTPGHLQSRTLAEALQRLVDAVATESGMVGTLRVDGEPVVLAANSEVVLLRTAQEGLSNIRRHSRARSFEVSLTYAADGPVALVVSDDGVGFMPDSAARGYGLDGATARAAEVGGRFDLVSAPGRGARLRVEVPR